MPFIPHTEAETRAMLDVIGVDAVDELFDEIEPALKTGDFPLPDGVGEMAMRAEMAARAAQNATGPCFLGAGCYDHHIPAAVWDIAARGEFLTAYTPYQAEASQGTLQLVYEYQSMMTALTEMDVTNASLYDGGSALGEAVLMAVRARRRGRPRRGAAGREPGGKRGGGEAENVLVAGACHPFYLQAAANIVRNQGIELLPTGFGKDGCTDVSALSGEPAAVIVQQPNFFGCLEPVDDIARWAHARGALLIGVVNPVALALLKPPGEWGEDGADIACGDGQPLGIPMASGGPSFGFICARERLVRQLPGRIVGRTLDRNGAAGFTLTLQAREQHIRRGKATSNICTNQGLLVTAATIHLALMGAEGLSRTAAACHARTHDLVRRLTAIDGVEQRFSGDYFHECALDVGRPADAVAARLGESGLLGGLPLGALHPQLDDCLLVCATERRTEQDIERLEQALRAALA